MMLNKLLVSTGVDNIKLWQKIHVSNLDLIYIKILGLLHELETRDNFLKQCHLPKLNGKQLIAFTVAAESLGIDSERLLFKLLQTTLAGQIDRCVFNR